MSHTKSTRTRAAPTEVEDRWADARRIESWAGEVRVNLVRLAALIAFYGQHLVNVYLSPNDPSLTGAYHLAVTSLCMAWSIVALMLYVCLSRRWLPPGLGYAATAADLVLITALLALGGDPRSPLLVLYFLVIAAAPLRLSLGLVNAAAIGSVLGYLFLLGHHIVRVGYERYYSNPELRIPRTHEAIVVLGLATAGVLAGQVVRQARRLALGYPVAVGEAKETGHVG